MGFCLVLHLARMVFQLPPGRIERAAYGSLKVSIGAMADDHFFSLYLQVNSNIVRATLLMVTDRSFNGYFAVYEVFGESFEF